MTERAPRADSLYVRGPVQEKKAAQQVLHAEGLPLRRFLIGCLRALLADPPGFLASLDGHLPAERRSGRPRKTRRPTPRGLSKHLGRVDGMTDLNAWWDNLPDNDRALFLAHADTSPLPGHVVERFVATRQMIAGTKWEDQPGYAFHWPSWVQAFLREKAAEQPA